MDFGCAFDDDLFGDEKKTKNYDQQKESYVPKNCTEKWFVSKKLSSEEEPSLEECQLIKYQADLLFFRRDYGGALQKYEERLQYFTNLNNNSMLREVHGSIINCHLKLGSVENALHHVKEILGTTGNPFDSYIYLLAHQVYLITGNVQESGRSLFTALKINPWYVDYWLMFFRYLDGILQKKRNGEGYTHDVIQLSDEVQLESFDEEFLKLLLVHIEFVFGENLKSNENCGNLKNDSTQGEIDALWIQLDKSTRKKSRELYHVMSRSKKADDVIRTHACFEAYTNVLAKPLSEAKNF